ncbi:hypothetical protein CFOL_v3_01915 [Cephalotus follicularis]|uniref:Uncharacterized protein n=1 Tax=Cephalotus follicularis TaxID=3775 RepID=A0A1Q3ARN2_CEPFO|nr:hypothetical protein CFOL_v3_01915 [Cephalotus follicularis]
MAGSLRFESSSASPDELAFAGHYPNGQRGNYSSASLDRSGSFREGSESRIFSSGTSTSRGSSASVGDGPPLTQWLMLDPIAMGDQKYTRLGELRRALGISSGSTQEDNSFKAVHSKPPPPVATEELKRFKASVLDASDKARSRATKLDESLRKLNKYFEAFSSKKQEQNDMLTSERSGASNLSKLGNLMQRNCSDLVTQRSEERTKNVSLNKRVRTAVSEIRAESRSNALARQTLFTGKDKDMLKDGGDGSDMVEEKIRRLPAGREGWERKIKRKRSVGTTFTRPVDGDGESKRVMHHKLNNEPGLQSLDVQGFRSGSSNSTSGINKVDGTPLSATSTARLIPKTELEKVSNSRDYMAESNKERLVTKANNRLSMHEDSHVVSPITVTKGKASRAPRTGPVMAGNSSPNFPRTTGALDSWEQPPTLKAHSLGGANNRKRPMPTGSTTPRMTQWVGQRPQKISRTRRANLVSPVSNLDEVQTLSEGFPSDVGVRTTSIGTNGLLLARGVAHGTHQYRVKHEYVSSPARLSESEEFGAGENRLKEKGSGSNEVEERVVNAVHSIGPSLLLSKKNKILNKEEVGDGVRRQGQTGRGSSFSRASSLSPMREKLENTALTKPLKNASKSGRPPLKKLSDRKGFTCIGHTPNGVSPDFTGESDDDREELLAAANFACNASFLACSGSFWKKMEPIFSSVSLEDKCYLKQQLKYAEEFHESLPQGGFLHEDLLVKRKIQDKMQSKEPVSTQDFIREVQDIGNFCGTTDSGKNTVTPFYHRVLSALIVDDETDEVENNIGERNMFLQYSGGTCLPNDVDSRNRDRTEFRCESMSVPGKQYTADRFFCNGSNTLQRGTGVHNQICDEALIHGDRRFMYPEIEMLQGFSDDGGDGPLNIHVNASWISSLDCQYEQICLEDKLILELQSIGLFPEAVPDLADGEGEAINQDIGDLQKGHNRQIAKKKEHLNKIIKAIEEVEETDGPGLEQVATHRLVELAYKKQLATRGSSAMKLGVPKVSKQVALSFMKRTLARCRKFEDTGKSCFSEPILRDVIFSAHTRGINSEFLDCFDSAVATNLQTESNNSQPEMGTSGSFSSRAERHNFRGSLDAFESLFQPSDQDFAKTGPILNRGKKKEVLLDDVGGIVSLRPASALGNTLLGGAKGKRSERERDIDTLARNSVAKAARMSHCNVKGERKTKPKPKQKTAQLSTAGNGFINKLTETCHSSGSSEVSNKKKVAGLIPHGNKPRDSSGEIKEPMDMPSHELDSIELGVPSEDLSSWFNFEEDNLQDHDLVGLEIPLDDLSELQMF